MRNQLRGLFSRESTVVRSYTFDFPANSLDGFGARWFRAGPTFPSELRPSRKTLPAATRGIFLEDRLPRTRSTRHFRARRWHHRAQRHRFSWICIDRDRRRALAAPPQAADDAFRALSRLRRTRSSCKLWQPRREGWVIRSRYTRHVTRWTCCGSLVCR